MKVLDHHNCCQIIILNPSVQTDYRQYKVCEGKLFVKGLDNLDEILRSFLIEYQTIRKSTFEIFASLNSGFHWLKWLLWIHFILQAEVCNLDYWQVKMEKNSTKASAPKKTFFCHSYEKKRFFIFFPLKIEIFPAVTIFFSENVARSHWKAWSISTKKLLFFICRLANVNMQFFHSSYFFLK